MNLAALMGTVSPAPAPPEPAYCTVAYPGTGDGYYTPAKTGVESAAAAFYEEDVNAYMAYDLELSKYVFTLGGSRKHYINTDNSNLLLIWLDDGNWAVMVGNGEDDPSVYRERTIVSSASTPPTTYTPDNMQWDVFLASDYAVVSGHPTSAVNGTYRPSVLASFCSEPALAGYAHTVNSYYMYTYEYSAEVGWWLSADSNCSPEGTAVAWKSPSASSTPPAGAWDSPP